MLVKRIEVAGFTVHQAHRTFELPETGLVVVTGANGSGKSSLVEAVAAGVWGDSLRGEAPWREGEPGLVRVELREPALSVERKRTAKGKGSLTWQRAGAEPVAYETATKAQAALEAVPGVGPFDVWRRTCVLSSADSAHFANARDVDRKRLLEDFLGLSRFDSALSACKADLRSAEAALRGAQGTAAGGDALVSSARDRLAGAERNLASAGGALSAADLHALREKGKRAEEHRAAAERDLRAAEAKVAAALEHARTHARHAQEAEAFAGKLGGMATCPTCRQEVAGEAKARAAAEAGRLGTVARSERDAAQEVAATWQDEINELREQVQGFAQRAQEAREALRVADATAKARQGAQAEVDAARKALELAEAKVAGAAAQVTEQARKVAVLTGAERALGMRGIRAQVLSTALAGLEAAANDWLLRFPTAAGALEVEIRGSSELKGGGTAETISLKVRAPGRSWQGYGACSGGERRRVDVALLLSLRDLAHAAHGTEGVLFCDEVFDALDTDGVRDVAEVLRELAHSRPVVVITHNLELVSALRPETRIELGKAPR